MRDLAIRAAGCIGILVAIIHGVIAEVYVFPKATVEPERTRTLLRLLWQATTLDWIVVGVLLIAAPNFANEAARPIIVYAAILIYGYAAAANAIATGGHHIGWVLMVIAALLAFLGR